MLPLVATPIITWLVSAVTVRLSSIDMVEETISAFVFPTILFTTTETEPAPAISGWFFGGSSLPACFLSSVGVICSVLLVALLGTPFLVSIVLFMAFCMSSTQAFSISASVPLYVFPSTVTVSQTFFRPTA